MLNQFFVKYLTIYFKQWVGYGYDYFNWNFTRYTSNGRSKKLEEASPESFPKGGKMLNFYIICFKQVRGSYVKQHFSSNPIIT